MNALFAIRSGYASTGASVQAARAALFAVLKEALSNSRSRPFPVAQSWALTFIDSDAKAGWLRAIVRVDNGTTIEWVFRCSGSQLRVELGIPSSVTSVARNVVAGESPKLMAGADACWRGWRDERDVYGFGYTAPFLLEDKLQHETLVSLVDDALVYLAELLQLNVSPDAVPVVD